MVTARTGPSRCRQASAAHRRGRAPAGSRAGLAQCGHNPTYLSMMPGFLGIAQTRRVGRTPLRAAVIAAIGFTAAAAFQVALALGAPLGMAAWGGRQRVLPGALRLASAGAAVILVAAAAVVV